MTIVLERILGGMQKKLVRLVIICLAGQSTLMPLMPIAYAQNSQGMQSNGTIPDNASVTLSFSNADIESVASVLAKATGQTILVDPKVKGSINLISNKPLSKAKALDAFSTALRTSGFSLVDVNGVFRVVSEVDAKLISNSVLTGKSSQAGDQILTRVFKLNYESANNLLPVLRPLVSPNNTINAYPGNNTIVITDYASNIQRIGELIEAIDAPVSMDVQTIKLRYAVAIDIASMLNKVLETGTAGNNDAGNKVIVMADARSNSLLLRSSSLEKVRQIRALVAKLDTPGNANGNIWVVPLRNAEAAKLAVTLRAIVVADAALSAQVASGTVNQTVGATGATTAQMTPTSGAPGSGGTAAATSALTSSSAPSTGGIIQADPATNSLIITANEPLYRNLRHVIDQLDKRRGQVYIESIIVEVSSTNAAELGIQWQGLVGSGNQNTGFGGTNFTGADGVPGSNITNLSRNVNAILNPNNTLGILPVQPNPGLNLGLLTKFNGVYGMSALITALSTTTGTNILSTPNLITLDNEEARIVVGQNIPLITGSYATTGTTATATPFTTVTRQDVGLILRVKPQISENGLVKMQIYQEVSNVASQVPNQGPILNKRDIETNVIVDDGQTLVLGGLIENNYRDSTSGIPWLSQIPIIGALFRYDNSSRTKTNLLVFLRPYVLRDKGQDQEITASRMQFMEDKQAQFKPSTMLLPKQDQPKLSDVIAPLVAPGTPIPPSAPIIPGGPAPAPVAPTSPTGPAQTSSGKQ